MDFTSFFNYENPQGEPESASPSSDIHRFWAQTGSMYATGLGQSVPADPFISMSLMPAVSSHFRDMTSIRFEHPEFIPCLTGAGHSRLFSKASGCR